MKAVVTPLEKRLARRIHKQRAVLRQQAFEGWGKNNWWRRQALAYRRQLEHAGIKPNGVWPMTYRKRL